MPNPNLKPFSSPTRTDTFPPPPITTFLRTNFRSKSTRRSKSSSRLIFLKRRRLTTEIETEPSSPKVTCIGQVRLRKTTPSRRYRFRVSKSPVFCCRWFVRARYVTLGTCSKYFRKLTWQRISTLLQNWLCFGAGGQQIVNPEENRTMAKSQVQMVNTEIISNDVSPPRNAFLLTRCRSASSSIGTTMLSSNTEMEMEKENEGAEREVVRDSTMHVREDKCALKNEPGQRDSISAGESRRDLGSLKCCENRGGGEVVVVLKRCKSEPGRVMERLVSDPEVDFRRRKSGFDAIGLNL